MVSPLCATLVLIYKLLYKERLMCGIYGAIGVKGAVEALERLEYRGYDSAGLAGISGGEIVAVHRVGKVKELKKALPTLLLEGAVIAHTRWATHGAITEKNAHPILSPSRRFACVHNGIIENSHALKKELGGPFATQTDTEVIVQLAERLGESPLLEIVQGIAKRLEGRSSFVLIDKEQPKTLMAAALGSSLIIGIGQGLIALASDEAAFDERIQRTCVVPMGHFVEIQDTKARLFNPHGGEVPIETEPFLAEKSGAVRGAYDHFMLKEICEQPDVLGRLLKQSDPLKPRPKRVLLLGCGTSWHAAGIGAEWIEALLGIPAQAVVASEFRYGPAVIDKETLVIALSQSGETADTLAGIERAKERGARIVALCNKTSSAIGRLADENRPLMAGPEIGVASTKTYTATLARLWQMVGEPLPGLSADFAELLEMAPQIEQIAHAWSGYDQMLMIGRGPMLWTAREAALKIKELAYVHASAYAAGELKHGPIALIEPNCPTVIFCSEERLAPKILSSLNEVQARQGKALLIAPRRLASYFEETEALLLPSAREEHDTFIASGALQLFAYHVAKKRGCAIDQPRNLAKSVTVE